MPLVMEPVLLAKSVFLCLLFAELSHAARMSFQYTGVYFSENVIPGYNAIYASSPNDCANQCMALVACKAYTYYFPNSCNFYQTSYKWSGTSDLSYVSGAKVPSGVVTRGSISYPTFTSSNGFHIIGSPLVVASKLKLAYRRSQWGYVSPFEPIEIFRYSGIQYSTASFTTAFSFQTNNLTGSPAGDGFSFIITPSRDIGYELSYINYLGYGNSAGSNAIAIEFDTYQNPEYNDPDSSHVGINLNFNATSDVTASTSSLKISLNDRKVKYAWVVYDAISKVLSVYLNLNNIRPNTPLIRYPVNLKEFFKPDTCPTCYWRKGLFFGFGVSNRDDIYQSIDILSWGLNTTFHTNRTNPTVGSCVSVPGVYFGESGGDQYYSASSAACCKRCFARPDCQSYFWSAQYRTCYIRFTAGRGAQYDSTVIGGYIPVAPSPHPTTLNFPNLGSTDSDPSVAYNAFQLRGNSVFDDTEIVLTYGQYQVGFAYYRRPVQVLRDDAAGVCTPLSFTSNFTFQIHDGSVEQFGSGFAFFLIGGNAYDRTLISSYGDADMGLHYNGDFNTLPGILAIEFDTYKDGSVNDPDSSHVGINLRFDGYSAVTAFTPKFGISLNDTKVKYVWIKYAAAQRLLSVSISASSVAPAAPQLQLTVDLCQQFRQHSFYSWEESNVFLGFAGKTTAAFETVDIATWRFGTY